MKLQSDRNDFYFQHQKPDGERRTIALGPFAFLGIAVILAVILRLPYAAEMVQWVSRIMGR